MPFGISTSANASIQHNDSNIKNSLKDSNGNTLTKEQQEYFKDSKVRDTDGNLQVVYHGRGFYFSTSNTHAGQYGNTYKGYLNIVNPLSSMKDTHDITKNQLKKFIQELADNKHSYTMLE